MNITRIYLVENCYNDPNKVYIGKTKDSRFSSHKRTYGKDIIYTYIDEIDSLDKKYWKPLEQYWIEQFRQWGFKIMNKNKGGGGPDFWTLDQKESIKGRHITSKHIEAIRLANSKPRNDEFKIKMKNIRTGTKHLLSTKEKISHSNIGKHSNKGRIRKIKQLNKFTNEILQIFPSIRKAAESINILKYKPIASGIESAANPKCCKQKTAYGYKWEYC